MNTYIVIVPRGAGISSTSLRELPGVSRFAWFGNDDALSGVSRHGLPPAGFHCAAEIVASVPPAIDAWVYRVEENRVKQYARTWPDLHRTPGVFIVSPVHRAPSMTHDEFVAHWRDQHGLLALKHHVGMWDYRQHVVVDCLSDGAPAYDGIGVLGFPTIEAFENEMFDSREGRKIIGVDTARFIDVSRLEVALVTERIVVSGE